MKLHTKFLALFAILGVLAVAQVHAESVVPEHAPVWFSSLTSNSLNHSSVALANHRHIRAVRYAKKALNRELSTDDRVIANLNLCLSYLSVQKPVSAEAYCSQAIRLSQGPWMVVRERGAHYIRNLDVSSFDHSEVSLLQVVVSTIVDFEPASDLAIASRVCSSLQC